MATVRGAAALEGIDRRHLARGAAAGQHDRLPFVDPAAHGGHRAGRHVAAAERLDHHAVVLGPGQVEHGAVVSHHERDQRHAGAEPVGLHRRCGAGAGGAS